MGSLSPCPGGPSLLSPPLIPPAEQPPAAGSSWERVLISCMSHRQGPASARARHAARTQPAEGTEEEWRLSFCGPEMSKGVKKEEWTQNERSEEDRREAAPLLEAREVQPPGLRALWRQCSLPTSQLREPRRPWPSLMSVCLPARRDQEKTGHFSLHVRHMLMRSRLTITNAPFWLQRQVDSSAPPLARAPCVCDVRRDRSHSATGRRAGGSLAAAVRESRSACRLSPHLLRPEALFCEGLRVRASHSRKIGTCGKLFLQLRARTK